MSSCHGLKGPTETGWRNHAQRRGFTLLELTVALGVFVVFAVSLTSVTTSALNTQAQLRARTNATVALERAADRVIDVTGFAALAADNPQLLIPTEQRTVCENPDGTPDMSCETPPAERRAMQECIARFDPGAPRQGCVMAGQSALLVTYSAESASAPLRGNSQMREPYIARVFAFTTLPTGAQLTITRTAATPAGGAASQHGYVRIVLPEAPEDFFSQTLLNGEGTTLFTPKVRLVQGEGGSATPVMVRVSGATEVEWVSITGREIMLQVTDPAQACPRSDPCHVELDGGRYSLSDRYMARGDTRVVLGRGTVVNVALQLATGPSVLMRLDTLPVRADILTGAPERGSVCLWGAFTETVAGENGQEEVDRAEVWCNNTSANEILMRGWVSGGVERELPSGDMVLWVSPPFERTVIVDDEGREITDEQSVPAEQQTSVQNVPRCGVVEIDGAVRWDGTGWQEGVTCTGWTWGTPSVLATSVLSRQTFIEGATTITLTPGTRREMTLYWTPQGGIPAAGCTAGDRSWALPRRHQDRPDAWLRDQQGEANCTGEAQQLRRAPVWATAAELTGGTAGQSYSERLVADATPAATFQVTDGSLPEGLALSSATGNLTGTPQTAGTYQFTVTAQNSLGATQRTFTLQVQEAGE